MSVFISDEHVDRIYNELKEVFENYLKLSIETTEGNGEH